MRRIRPFLEPLFADFAATLLQNPVHDAILVGITDDKGGNYFEEIPNNEGCFQVLAGFDSAVPLTPQNDPEIIRLVFGTFRRAVVSCGFARSDHQTFEQLLDRWAEANLPQ